MKHLHQESIPNESLVFVFRPSPIPSNGNAPVALGDICALPFQFMRTHPSMFLSSEIAVPT
jgi:hypothetical protein